MTLPPLVDSHMHLQDPALAGDLPGVLRRSAEAGVRFLICNGTHEQDWARVAELARTHESVVPCFGLHPWYVSQRSPDWLSNLQRWLDAMPSAIGEIGLDRWIEPRDEPAQELVFRSQLDQARQRGLPVMIHCLRAWGWLMDVLQDQAPLPAGMLIHAYGGPVEMIRPLAERGAYFSFAGNMMEEKRRRAREALAAVPENRLLLETDSPDMLPPQPHRPHALLGADGKHHNEPANLPAILAAAAQLRGQSAEQLAQSLWTNARRFFGRLLD